MCLMDALLQVLEKFIPTSHDLASVDAAANHVRTAMHQAGLVLHTFEIFKSQWEHESKEHMMG